MKCTEKNCSTVLNEDNTFVRPLATVVAEVKKPIITLIRADLMKGAICDECAFIAASIGEDFSSLTQSLAEVARQRAKHDATVVARIEADKAEARQRFAAQEARLAAAEKNVRQHARKAVAFGGAQNLGVLLLAQGFRPSAKLATAGK